MGAQSIAINALSQTIGGGVAVARNLTAAIAKERPTAQFTMLCSSREVANAPYPSNVTPTLHPTLDSLPLRIAWEQARLPRVLRQVEADTLLNLGGFSSFATDIPQVSVWQNPNIYTRVAIRRSTVVRAQIILQRWAQSWSMKKSALNIFLSHDGVRECATRWPMDKISHRIIYHGLDRHTDPKDAAPTVELDRPFVLAVGHCYFHKNYETLIDAMAWYRSAYGDDLMLVIAGGAISDSHYRNLQSSIEHKNLEATIRFLGPTSRDQVTHLYRHARAYVTTSLLESFGLTPLEAMSNGLPALVSNASCLFEICGEAALYCDPCDPEDIARKLHELCTDDAQREILRERGLDRVTRFTWESCARDYLSALDSCLPD
jgi:glycosyltransferase involved in cell wall biosynthesis